MAVSLVLLRYDLAERAIDAGQNQPWAGSRLACTPCRFLALWFAIDGSVHVGQDGSVLFRGVDEC